MTGVNHRIVGELKQFILNGGDKSLEITSGKVGPPDASLEKHIASDKEGGPGIGAI